MTVNNLTFVSKSETMALGLEVSSMMPFSATTEADDDDDIVDKVVTVGLLLLVGVVISALVTAVPENFH